MFKNSYKFLISKVTNKNFIILLSIILIGAFLRLYNFEELLRFNNDQVRDIQIVEQIKNGETIFLGPKAGGTKFNLGPAFYYLEYLSGLIFGFSPSGVAFFIPILSILSIYLFYLLFKKIFSTKISLGLTFLYAISFYAIKYSHFAWNPNILPFFILAFLLLISKISEGENNHKNFSLLGIIIGIGIQLHTTLLILMPLFTGLVFIYFYFKKIKFDFKNILLLSAVILIPNSLFIYGDFLNNWDNAREFIAGTETKTDGKSSIFKNFFSTIQFFLQGFAYHLTGMEPQKNWINIVKLIKSKNINEILLFLLSISTFVSGTYLLVKNRLKFINNFTLLSLVTYTILVFSIFLPLGDDLNIRFFIVLQFLPYLLLGLIFLAIKNIPILKKTTLIVVLAIASLLFISNIIIFSKTYNLDNYSAPESAYGGISCGELRDICNNIKIVATKNNLEEIYLIKGFEYKNSLEYACKKQNLDITFVSEEDSIRYPMTFDILKENIPLPENKIIQENISIQRFKLLLLKN